MLKLIKVNLNIPKSILKMEISKIFPPNLKFQDQMIHCESYQNIKERYLHKHFCIIEEESTHPNSFYEANLTLIPKPAKTL